MLGIVPKGSSALNSDIIRQFRNLASSGLVKAGSPPGHADGWGIVTWENNAPVHLAREPTDASSDPKYDLVCKRIDEAGISSPLIAHLRKASVGAKNRENTHPFTAREWAFAHNGTIRKMNLEDRTDSEWFFKSLMEELRPCNGDVVCAIARQVATVREVYQYSSLTFLLSNGNTLYAYRDCTDSEDYYSIFYTRTNNAFVVTQQKVFESQWKELGNGQLLTVDRKMRHELFDISEMVKESNPIAANA